MIRWWIRLRCSRWLGTSWFKFDSIARKASHFTAKRASSAFVTIERLSTKTRWPRADRPLRWSAPTGSESNSKISEVEFLLVDFFPFIFVGSCIVRTFCICRSPHGLLSCLSFSACVNGRDVRELDDLFFRTTIGIQRAFKLKKPEWPCGWEYKQGLSCLVASSGRLQMKEKDVPEIHCTSICPAKLYLQGPSVVPDFQCPNNFTLIFELRSADCLESLPLLSSKTPRKNSSCKCNVWCCCERLPDVRSHLRTRWSRRTINHNASHSTKTVCRTGSARLVELALRSCSDHWSD